VFYKKIYSLQNQRKKSEKEFLEEETKKKSLFSRPSILGFLSNLSIRTLEKSIQKNRSEKSLITSLSETVMSYIEYY